MSKRSKSPDHDPYTVADLIDKLESLTPTLPVVIFNSRGEYEAPTVTIVVKVNKGGGIAAGKSTILLSAESDE